MSVFSDAISNYLSPIKDLLDDPTVSEIMINGAEEIFVERKGLVYKVPNKFQNEAALLAAFRSVAQSVGRVIDQDSPRLDARLPNGSRIHVVLPPMARRGTTVAIRKFAKEELTLKDLISSGALSAAGARFLDIAVFLGKNIIVSGGTGSGKTTLLNILGGRVPKAQRLIIIEDSAELQIHSEHVVPFEARKANDDLRVKEVSIRELVLSAMRLRPDRVIVGEVRGEEALDLIQVMNTGHDGSMGTVHANNPLDTCTRLESLCLIGDTRIPPDAIKKMVGSAVKIIVQCARYHDGGRRVSYISEVLGVDNHGNYIVKHIFRWVQTGKDAKTGKYIGEMVPCNYVPSFFSDIVVNKLPFPRSTFTTPDWVEKLEQADAA
ncbi:MAG: pilus assembly protein [Bdellovibrionales bacterium RIFOXYD12_FULL_39_22]|nr:MAG: pilus assembly protein [Bdellovibrionales bacterium RIFOXYB1_FULL_39_21]OFZ40931.1 MAG: pilus assembly protein [Bdellovibrionales bacterium RIFOXYC12_FULL_39_17]OFZ44767.1 MAG: pilus assembly protein [Bdellovibrionales bacterium RIFOXYC1_FULL_39_130]OFZ71567.1 MAG: pilus assembly protein [Bdellovibrionales bacterium RIFOXYC2_FULL_39_8]OFZ74211.1 MAG: pilus assembly protein [Bdellovibrionales bacterium RIFOXYD1_FULL_39_84]OFZ92091.1 MAG: pilus assembly protein [Bdellovibrionales bacteri